MADRQALIVLTPGFPSSEEDTTCLPMQQQLLNRISQTHPQLSVIVLSFQYPYHTNEYQWNQIRVIPFDGRNRGGVQRLLLRKKVMTALRTLSTQFRIKGLLSFWLGECALVGKRFGEKTGVPHYCWLLGQDARTGNKYVNRIKANGSELIALSDFLQSEFQRNYNIKPAKVILPGIEPVKAMAGERDISILGVGSLIPLKQFEIFIELVASIKNHFPQVKVVLIGDGPEKQKLLSLITQFDVENNVEFAGEVSHDEVLKMMTRSRILLHPSSYEGFSGVCMEALACGVHVISFCRAMDTEIGHWHIVQTKEEMKSVMIDLFSKELDHNPVVVSDMQQTASNIMQLFI